MTVPLPQLEAQYPVLAELPPQLREAVAGAAQAMTVPAGATLFDERQPCQGFPFVLAGAIRVAKVAANGRELPLYRVTPGETCIITSSCLLGNVPYNARGTTESETVLVLLPQGLFTELLAQTPFRNFIFNLFAERMADLMRLVEEVAFRKLDQRLAALLLGKGRIVHATHQQLADELGSVREMISRLLKGFAEQGWVVLGREQIEIRDAAGLRRLAETV
jgi:CRP/FNR family transcriptional regulator